MTASRSPADRSFRVSRTGLARFGLTSLEGPVKRRALACAVLLAAGLIVAGCASHKDDADILAPDKPISTLYDKGMQDLHEAMYQEATKSFDEVEREHPYSVWATKAQLMAAYAQYKGQKFDDAISRLERYIELHPGNADTPYAYYLKGLCYYEQIADVGRDQTATAEAAKAFQEVINRFPDSRYARDARLKIDMTQDHLAGKEMAVGRYYEDQKQYLAAINRFQIVIRQYQTTSQVPEALERLTECYMALGMYQEAKRMAAVLGYNYPGSGWYADAYSLVSGLPASASQARVADTPWYKKAVDWF